MIYFNSKCKCGCEYNAVKLEFKSREYTNGLVQQLTSVLIEAGILVETSDLIGLVKFEDKKYKVKKVK